MNAEDAVSWLPSPDKHATWTEARRFRSQIDTLEPIETTLRRRQRRLVLAWAELHQDELLETWRLARAGETRQEINPLQ